MSALPAGACLLHIGPYKTGSTAIQAALFEARDVLPEHGVVYPGRWRRAMRPGWAVLDYVPRGRRPTPISVWEEFCAEVQAASDQRVCVSTEDFGSAGPDRIARIVAGLGSSRLHVVAVVRRLDRLLPSQWQERVKSHDPITYDAWLQRVLGTDPTDREHQRFWASHDLVAMADRWRSALGPDRFTFLAADETDPDVVPRAFEELLDLPTGLLQLPPASNASLSANATELVRRVNELFEGEGWPDETYHRMVQQAAVQQLIAASRPDGEERIPPLPGWAAARVDELSRQRAQEIRDRGIPVLGAADTVLDPSPSTAPADAIADAAARPEVVSLETAVTALAAMVDTTVAASRKQRRRSRRSGRPDRPRRPRSSGPALEDITGRELLRAVAGRVARRPSRSSR